MVNKAGVWTFLNIALAVVIVWVIFLYCYHHNSLHEAEQAVRDVHAKTSLTDLLHRVQKLTQDEKEAIHKLVDTELDKHFGRTIDHKRADGEPAKLETAVEPKPRPVVDNRAPQSPDTDENYHIAFSTDCTFFQDWQTLLIFHSAVMIKQKGRVTRIASGCDDEKKAELTELYKKLYPQFSVHFTPDFKTDGKTKKKYEFYNKPYGVQHWLTHAEPPIPSGTVINIIDPDMVLLRPMTPRIRGNPSNIYLSRFDPTHDVVPERVQHGTAVAQLYGLGAPWAQAYHKHFNRTEICGEGSPCLKTTVPFGEAHYSVGPPYILEKDDMLALVNTWTKFVPRVYEKYPSLLAEMYAYSMAAAHVDLPHFTMESLMVSNVHAGDEGWKWIDMLEDNVCEPPVDGVFYPGKVLPDVLHFCQFYRAGEFGFQKRRIKKQMFECGHEMMAELPRDLGKINYKNRDGEIIKLGKTEARRNAFMLCTIHNAINGMVTHYKQVMCGPGEHVNLNKSINVVSPGYYG